MQNNKYDLGIYTYILKVYRNAWVLDNTEFWVIITHERGQRVGERCEGNCKL